MRFPLHDTYGFCDRNFRKFLRQVDLPRIVPALLYDKWCGALTRFLAENFVAGRGGFPPTELLQKTIHAQPLFQTDFNAPISPSFFAAHLCQIAKYCIICHVFLGGIAPLNGKRGEKWQNLLKRHPFSSERRQGNLRCECCAPNRFPLHV